MDGKILWRDCHWEEIDGRKQYGTKTYFVKDGILRSTFAADRYYDYYSHRDDLKKWLKSLGYDWIAFSDSFVEKSVLGPFVGKPIEEVEQNVRFLAAKLHNRRIARKAEMDSWNDLSEQFKGYVVSLAKDHDVYSTGFSVRVLLSSEKDYQQRKSFVVENKKELLRWAMQQIRLDKVLMRKIGDLSYYKPVEIVTLRAPELEIKFEVKDLNVIK